MSKLVAFPEDAIERIGVATQRLWTEVEMEAARHRRDGIYLARIACAITDGPSRKLAFTARRFGWRCYYCNIPCVSTRYYWTPDHGQLQRSDFATLDRVVPGSQGGTYTSENTVLACQWCNVTKGARSVCDFLACLTKMRGEIATYLGRPVLWQLYDEGRAEHRIQGGRFIPIPARYAERIAEEDSGVSQATARP